MWSNMMQQQLSLLLFLRAVLVSQKRTSCWKLCMGWIFSMQTKNKYPAIIVDFVNPNIPKSSKIYNSESQKTLAHGNSYVEMRTQRQNRMKESHKHHNDNNPNYSDTNKHNNNTIKQHSLFQINKSLREKKLLGILGLYNTSSLIFLLLSPLILPWSFIS